MLLVMGKTGTRFSVRLEASLLSMRAGRFLVVSPPNDGSKLTHQTGPRAIGHISTKRLTPFGGFLFAGRVGGHGVVVGVEGLWRYVGAGEVFEELADAATAQQRVEAAVDVIAETDGETLRHLNAV